VLLALNDGDRMQAVGVQWGGEWFSCALEAGAVATFTWQGEPAPVLLDMSVAPEPTLEPAVMPDVRGWEAVGWRIGDQLRGLEPLITRRLGRRGLLALVAGGSLLTLLLYRTIRRRPML
jgi:hypothetical protein